MPQPAAKKGNALTRKLGPLPVWAWLLIGSAIGWYVFKRLGSQSQATTGTQAGQPATDQGTSTGLAPSGTSGASGTDSGGVSGPDFASALGAQQSALQAIADQLNQLQSQLASQVPGGYQVPGGGDPGIIVPGPYQPPGPSGTTTHPVTYHPVSISTPNFGAAAKAQSQNIKQAGGTPAFGGVTSVVKLHNGSTVTTYANGRKVQQMPGKTAYVIHR